ncbi:metal-dependent hydrolase [Natronosalvus rutilus]|uniref:Metal-dependent hydrolase n=1 Tax=Natronosalvus rutilus TaxID=2953753 RepID=A0A9E7SY72_9EURY|nr:metal-dependent hydrolase [Natronosalvus rutilus]UTF54763.1 metal-dependent hydrolase [Natronosalvus rutilus]
MPELLTHVLVGFTLATVLSWYTRWLTAPYVTVAMVGAVTPDLSRFDLLFPAKAIEAALGIPFDWWAFHTLGGTVLVVALGGLLTPTAYRRGVVAMLALGALSHHGLDLLLVNPSGYAYPVFWPLTQYHPPTPGFYLSSDRWPAFFAGVGATVVWAIDHRR